MYNHTHICYIIILLISGKKLITVIVVEILFTRTESIVCYLKKNIFCGYREYINMLYTSP